MRKPAFAYAKTKTQISCAVTAQLISALVFAIRIVQSLYYLNPKSQASSHLLWLYSLVCVGPGRKPRRPVFSQRGSPHPERYLSTTMLSYLLAGMYTPSHYEFHGSHAGNQQHTTSVCSRSHIYTSPRLHNL